MKGTGQGSGRQASGPVQLGLEFVVRLLSRVPLFATPVVCSLSGFSVHGIPRQEYQSGSQSWGYPSEAGINHSLVTFLDHSFGSQDVSGL